MIYNDLAERHPALVAGSGNDSDISPRPRNKCGVTSIAFNLIILLSLSTCISACGVKGKLKTPDQIEKEEAKKAAKAAKEQQKKGEQEIQTPDQQNQEQK